MDNRETVDPLTLIGLAAATDKAWLHAYTPHYHRRFEKMRYSEITVLELGIGGEDNGGIGGHSLRMWSEYFPNARIVGLDLYDKSSLGRERVFIERGSQSDPETVKRLTRRYGPFDIIIDDGSHRTDDVVSSLRLFWPTLSAGGIYAIEDLDCAYVDGYNCGRPADDPKLSTNVVTSQVLRLLGRPATATDEAWTIFEGTLNGVHVAEDLVFFDKEEASGSRAVSGVIEPRLRLALAEVERAVQITGNPLPFALTKGRILHELGRSGDALEWIRRACKFYDDAETWHFYGNLLLHDGDLNGALQAQLRSIERSDRNPHVYAAVGVAFAKLGRAAEAEAAFESALALSPHSTELKEVRERALRLVGIAQP